MTTGHRPVLGHCIVGHLHIVAVAIGGLRYRYLQVF
jgi:hypothetical protein